MADNAQLIAQCEARAKEWLSPAFDEETRKEVQAMLDDADKTALIDTSTLGKISNRVQPKPLGSISLLNFSTISAL